jgi:hypothetical protein
MHLGATSPASRTLGAWQVRDIIARLERGERYWPAELVFRPIGLALLCGCGALAQILRRQLGQLPAHGTTPAEFGVAALIVCCLWIGLSLTFVGPALLRRIPIPPRAYL